MAGGKWLLTLSAAVIAAGATLVASWPKPLFFYESLISREKCHLIEANINKKIYRHTYCFDYLRKDCGLRHLDLNGENHFNVLQATRCEENGYEVIAVRPGDKYKVIYSLDKTEDSEKWVFKSQNHLDAEVQVTSVRPFVQHYEK